MIHRVIQILIPCWSWYLKSIIFVWFFYIYYAYYAYYALINQHMFLSFSSLFYLWDLTRLWESSVLLFSEFINIVSILFYNVIEFIILLYTSLVTSFSRYKEYIISLISFCKFLDVLPTFTCARAIGNVWTIWFGLNIFNPFPCFALY